MQHAIAVSPSWSPKATVAAVNDDSVNAAVVAFRRVSMSGSSRESGNLRETIGATYAKVDLLLVRAEEDRREWREAYEKFWMELRAIKHEEANRAQVFSLRMEMSDRRAGETERRMGEVEEALKNVSFKLEELHGPVRQFVEIKGRLLWISGIVVAVAGALVLLVKPFWDGFASKWIKG